MDIKRAITELERKAKHERAKVAEIRTASPTANYEYFLGLAHAYEDSLKLLAIVQRHADRKVRRKR